MEISMNQKIQILDSFMHNMYICTIVFLVSYFVQKWYSPKQEENSTF